jgi:hypothetical protein
MGDFAGIPDNFTIPVPWRPWRNAKGCRLWLMALDGKMMGNYVKPMTDPWWWYIC